MLTGSLCPSIFSAWADPEFFARVGIQARLSENSSDNAFSSSFFSPQLILEFYCGLSMVYFNENYKFPRFQRGSIIFKGVQHFPGGGFNFSQGGSKC